MGKALPVNVKAMKKYRIIKGLTPNELAKKIGVSRQVVYRYESGEVVPSAQNMEKICKELSCTPEDIVKWDIENVEIKER